MGNKEKPETLVKFIECPEDTAGDARTANIQAPAAHEHTVAYAMATDEGGIQASSDTVELPDYPQWRGAE